MKRIFFALTTLIMVCSCSVYKVFKSKLQICVVKTEPYKTL